MNSAPTFDLVLLTDARYENPSRITPYLENILREDQLLGGALEALGLKVTRCDWNRADFDWRRTRSALFRTTWDYFDRLPEFLHWLEKSQQQTQLLNPPELVRWNLDKHYLRDLAAGGVTVTPTQYLERGTEVSLTKRLAVQPGEEMILKPCVSGAARHTYRINADNVAEVETTLQNLLRSEAFMLQPFQRAILDQGEISLIVIGGEVTHAVRKIARAGDFRVQDDHGGTVAPHQPQPDEIALARAAIAACHPTPLYARVDMARLNEGGMAIMELELIEPELFFRFAPAAAERLARVLAEYLAAAAS